VPLMAITLTAGAANSGRRHHVFFIFACIADRPVPAVWLPARPPFGTDRMQRRSGRHFGDARGPPLAARVCRQLRGTATALNTRVILTVGGRDNGSRCRSRSRCEFGISRERVRRIERRAFEKVRSAARRRVAAIDPLEARAAC
jgi:hypothetical protein